VGFASSAHFSAAFREMFGMMPSELLKTLEPVRD
jgi:AraC-like DNA-binding protein